MDMRSLIKSRDLKDRQAKRVDDAKVSMDRFAEEIVQTEKDIQLISLARGARTVQTQLQRLDLVDLAKEIRDIEVRLQTLKLQQNVHEVESRFQSLPDPSSILQDIASSRFMDVESYLDDITSDISRISHDVWQISDAHVRRLEDLVSSSKIQCQALANNFCKIVYQQTPYLAKRVSVSKIKLMRLETNLIAIRLETLQDELSSLQRTVQEEYLEPRASAREKIDGLLAEMNTTSEQYKEIQEKSQAVNEGAFAVMASLNALRYMDFRFVNEHGLGFADFTLLVDESRKRLGWLAHAFRSAWRESNKARGSFKDSSFWSTKDFTEVSRSSKYSEMSNLQVVKCRMFGHALKYRQMREFRFHEQVIDKHLHDLYTGRLAGKKMTTSQLSLAWRQLDNNAPFEIKLILDWWLHEEIHMMLRALDGSHGPLGSMFTQFNPNVIGAVKGDLKKLGLKFAESRKAFNVEFEKYKVINWYRLKVEERLLELREPNLIRQQGLFVPLKPLSRNKKRFDHWVNLYSSIAFRAWIARKINSMPHVTIINALGEETTPYGKMCSLYLSFLQSSVPEIGSVMTDRPRIRETKTTRRKRLLLPLFKRKFEEAACLPGNAMPSDNPTEKTPGSTPLAAQTEGSKLDKSSTGDGAETPKLPRHSGRRSRLSRFASKHGRDASKKSGDSTPQSRKPSAGEIPQRPEAKTGHRERSDTGSIDKKPADSVHHSPKPESSKPANTAATSAACMPPGLTHRPESSIAYDPYRPGPRRRFGTSSSSFLNTINNGNPKSIDEKHDTIHPNPKPAKRTLPWLMQRPEPRQRYDTCRPGPRRRFGTSSNNQQRREDSFWSHTAQRTPSGQKPIVHYCRTLENTEQVSQLFLDSKVIGFDMEWKANASSTDSIQNNVSLIQIASEERIALFQIALFKPAKTQKDFMAPSLKKILESPHITKVGVSIKGDTTRLRKFLGIDTRSILELSHLFRLVKYGQANPKLVNKRLVNLSDQVEEHLGLPLEKGVDVRCSDWTRPLNYQQVQCKFQPRMPFFICRVLTSKLDAATDPYACICLFNALERRRQAMNPMPPRPAHAELNMPIVLPQGGTVIAPDEGPAIPAAPDR